MNKEREDTTRRQKAEVAETAASSRQLIVHARELIDTARELGQTTEALTKRFYTLRAKVARKISPE